MNIIDHLFLIWFNIWSFCSLLRAVDGVYAHIIGRAHVIAHVHICIEITTTKPSGALSHPDPRIDVIPIGATRNESNQAFRLHQAL